MGAHYILMKNKNLHLLKFLYAQNRYGAYCVPVSSIHRPAAQIILRGRVHEPKTLEYIITHANTGDVLTAGAFFGDFLPAIATNVADTAHVWSFEPNYENYRCAQITCTLNDLSNVSLFSKGLGDIRRTVNLDCIGAQGESRGGGSTIITSPIPGKEYQMVDVVPFDDVFPNDRHISVVHLDIEGYEPFALRGALRTIRRCNPILILETVPNGSWFDDNILSLGYKPIGTLHKRNTIFKIA